MDPTQTQLVVRPKFTRAFAPKVRTGCRTCKTRHIKCDEEKPECRRCRTAGFKCDGYEPVQLEKKPKRKRKAKQQAAEEPTSSSASSSLVGTASPSPSEGIPLPHDHDYFFHHFLQSALQDICLSDSGEFWSRQVLPMSHTVEPIRCVVRALGAAHRFFIAQHESSESPKQLSLAPSHFETLAIRHYNQAIRTVVSSPAYDAQTSLICCILFVCLENMMGRYGEAIKHFQAGLRILNAEPFPRNESGAGGDAVREIAEVFHSIGMEIGDFIDKYYMPDPKFVMSDSEDESDPQPFRSYQEARQVLRSIDYIFAEYCELEDTHFGDCLKEAENTTPEALKALWLNRKDCQLTKKIYDVWDVMHSRFQAWNHSFNGYAERVRNSKVTTYEWQQMLLLTIRQAIWLAMLEAGRDWDQNVNLDHYDNALRCADLYLQSLGASGRATFASEGDFVSSLSHIALFCEDAPTTRRAINMLRSMRRREGVWDSEELAELHEAIVARTEAQHSIDELIMSRGGRPGIAQLLSGIGQVSFSPTNGIVLLSHLLPPTSPDQNELARMIYEL
ncbi:uncharacterized protein E0L32_002074 [Thyridium curvatum]|uniref:Zn(2)-C6 fungal-type domain-containing protein n=1 Tax=Thyridium curvatum TaxID=1093900 RepID=A0A507ALT1_9PEZI|nr:uncharacterized protein E0L32_002059 [Thyridium curvatum]XP_030989182.1 uncharacterized protein E0L32_002074 [Thyridium curvatum]TPX07456.1 hypothetical protein E0L32_002059 [Thyridium curvatum]TPX07471.1 hypothetical protein E0L32_002074 [Thyridium curvatum]